MFTAQITKNRIATMVVAIAVTALALFSTSTLASADTNKDVRVINFQSYYVEMDETSYVGSWDDIDRSGIEDTRGATVLNLAAFRTETVDAPFVIDQFDTDRSSLIIKLFSPAGTGSSLDMVRSGDSVVDLASFAALTMDAMYVGNWDDILPGRTNVIDFAAFYAGTTDAPAV